MTDDWPNLTRWEQETRPPSRTDLERAHPGVEIIEVTTFNSPHPQFVLGRRVSQDPDKGPWVA